MTYEYPDLRQRQYIGDWEVNLVQDSDGHLGVFIAHNDGTQVHGCDADIANENEWADRFTTEKIEEDYHANT